MRKSVSARWKIIFYNPAVDILIDRFLGQLSDHLTTCFLMFRNNTPHIILPRKLATFPHWLFLAQSGRRITDMRYGKHQWSSLDSISIPLIESRLSRLDPDVLKTFFLRTKRIAVCFLFIYAYQNIIRTFVNLSKFKNDDSTAWI